MSALLRDEKLEDVRRRLIEEAEEHTKLFRGVEEGETPEERRRRLFEAAEEYRRRHPVPSQEELLDRISRRRESTPRNPEAPDSVDLIREDRDC
ncbi:MAG TPA: hypothetical protein VE685_24215 [Thermoanaerobaculia bacterium]|nr:hypothetical protein [Thermoanaerobaculia bacterium]